MNDPTRTNLWHGYTLRDIDQLARTAVTKAHAGRLLDPTDRYNTAWSAIAEHLCTTTEPPTSRQLAITGMTAINQAGRDHRHTWGLGRAWDGHKTPQFERYWNFARATPSPEDRIIEHIAVRQIWPRLCRTHQQTLWALAIHGDCRAAAASLGKTERGYACALHRARAAYRALWHEHETPSQMWGKTGRSGRRTVSQVLADRRRQQAQRATAAGGEAA